MKMGMALRLWLNKAVFLISLTGLDILLQADPYMITNFILDQPVPASIDTVYFHPVDDSQFVSIPPERAQAGHTYLRVKSEGDGFLLMEGMFDTAAYRNLSIFRVEEGNLRYIASTRFFTERLMLPYHDIPVVYFSDEYVYLPGLPVIYHNNAGIWEKVFAENDIPGLIHIRTAPSGAEVRAAGSIKGLSPLSFSMPDIPYVRIHLEKPGYYPKELPLKADKGEFLQKEVRLVPRVMPLPPGKEKINIRKLSLHDGRNVWEYYDRLSILRPMYQYTDSLFLVADSLFDSVYPSLEPGPVEENSTLYAVRKREYEKERLSEKELMKTEFRQALADYGNSMKHVEDAIREIEFRHGMDTLRRGAVKEMTLNPEGNVWSITVIADTLPFRFRYSGSWKADEKKRSRLKACLDSADVVVYSWNLLQRIAPDKELRVALDSISLSCGGIRVVPEGTFFLPKQVMSSEDFSLAQKKAEGFREEIRRKRLESEEKQRLQAEEIIRQRNAARAKSRKSTLRLLSGAGWAITGAAAGYLAWSASDEADADYARYRAVLNRDDAALYRRRVEDNDKKAAGFGILSGVGICFSFLIFTF